MRITVLCSIMPPTHARTTADSRPLAQSIRPNIADHHLISANACTFVCQPGVSACGPVIVHHNSPGKVTVSVVVLLSRYMHCTSNTHETVPVVPHWIALCTFSTPPTPAFTPSRHRPCDHSPSHPSPLSLPVQNQPHAILLHLRALHSPHRCFANTCSCRLPLHARNYGATEHRSPAPPAHPPPRLMHAAQSAARPYCAPPVTSQTRHPAAAAAGMPHACRPVAACSLLTWEPPREPCRISSPHAGIVSLMHCILRSQHECNRPASSFTLA